MILLFLEMKTDSSHFKSKINDTMTNLISKLRLDTFQGNSKNIWLTLILIFLLMGLNYQSLVIPELLLYSLSICIMTFQIISLLSYSYLITKAWRTLTKDKRLNKIMYSGLLILATLLTMDFTRRILFHNG